jgi:4-carboxymuconolactone decarboxylase
MNSIRFCQSPSDANVAHWNLEDNTAMDDSVEVGKRVRIDLFGEPRLQQAFASQDDLTQKFQTLITSACFGQVWGDATIPWRERSLITMSIVGAQQRFTEFATHVELGLRNGCTREQIIQVVQHLTVYCGVPTGAEAFRIVHKLFAQSDGSAAG